MSEQRLGKYDLVRRVAQGGMADVYLARQVGIGKFSRHVALKVLNPVRGADAESRQMFLDEARLVALLHHHNLASVLEIDVADDVHYLAMEYVHGVDLRDLLAECGKTGCVPAYDCAMSIIAAAAAGLDHAHRRTGPDGKPLRLVHRDVSLSNIMVGHDGSVKVVDFGIAASAISTVPPSPGIVRGKASYMSPEQCLGDDVDLRTDVFALGIVLYELTTGARCFDGPADFDRMLAVVRGDYIRPSDIVPDYPPDLERVIRTALAVDATKRYASAAAMIEALEAVASVHGWSLGTSAITRTMRELYGDVPEPWAAEPSVDLADVCGEPTEKRPMVAFADTDVAPAKPTAPTACCKPGRKRFAAGSMSDLHVRTEWLRDDDDALTGRRRACSRLTQPPMAA
jgi:serine/threonine-protein kinase